MTVAVPVSASPDLLRKPLWTSLADNVANLIASAIATQRILPGARIVEVSLAEQLGVSRVPVREAFKVLHAQGILTGGGHRGYYVATFGPEGTQQILEVRLLLEYFLLRDAILNWRAGEEDIRALQQSIDDLRRAARAEDLPASLMADLAFHRVIRMAALQAVPGRGPARGGGTARTVSRLYLCAGQGAERAGQLASGA